MTVTLHKVRLLANEKVSIEIEGGICRIEYYTVGVAHAAAAL